jgi:hypothetical protein
MKPKNWNRATRGAPYRLEKGQATIVTRCPFCGHLGTFNRIGEDYLVGNDGYEWVGLRSCPNPDCLTVVFAQGRLAKFDVQPPPMVDFDTKNLPDRVKESLTEAITCHAHECYSASAIMLRRTLEDLCKDRGAQGGNLFQRLEDLISKIILPVELRDALHDLRLLGNDAAHVEATTFQQVAEEEVAVGIQFTKEILKATYQYSDLLSKLRGMKRPVSTGGSTP